MNGDDGASGSGRTILVLAYRWPPQGGGGVQRTLKLAKYLSHLGFRVVVHTVSNPYASSWDPTLQWEVPPDVTVYRTPTIEYESVRFAAVRLAARVRAALPGGSRKPSAPGDQAGATASARQRADGVAPAGTRAERRRRGRLRRLEDWFWSRVLVPDAQIVWAGFAYLAGLYIARREKPDLLYSSSPPNSVNVLALALVRRLRIPWIADFRDPWTDGVRRQQWYPDHPRRRRREEDWERAVLETANHVLVTAEPTRDRFLQKYPDCPSERVHVLTNGFDPADFAPTEIGRRVLGSGFLHLSLAGNVETMFDLGPFLFAVRELLVADPEARRVLRINFLGTRRQRRYDKAIAEYGIGDVVRFHAYMPHERVVRAIRESQALMLCQVPAQESGGVKLPGKMFEYLFTRKAILALTIPGPTASILDRAGVGRVVNPSDVAGIQAELAQFLDEFRHGGIRPTVDEEVIRTFDRRVQSKRVARLIDRSITEGCRSR